MDSRWQTKERETKGNVEKNSREGNEGAGMDPGATCKDFLQTDQTSVAVSGGGLMHL